jgi:quercetin dioxygenase-like cupin family protein
MKHFVKLNINDIPLEDAHEGSGKRKVLVKPEQVESPYLEAVVNTFLKSGDIFDWHIHQDTDEIFIVQQGEGMYYCEDESITFKKGDIMITPANLKHKIEAKGKNTSEFYFIRVKAK